MEHEVTTLTPSSNFISFHDQACFIKIHVEQQIRSADYDDQHSVSTQVQQCSMIVRARELVSDKY